ncbi:MAG: hypothetical protein K9M07_05630 [Simkaniaceae bacterium]|nr:hypothetical protein [Simkaniaceae bacterium]
MNRPVNNSLSAPLLSAVSSQHEEGGDSPIVTIANRVFDGAMFAGSNTVSSNPHKTGIHSLKDIAKMLKGIHNDYNEKIEDRNPLIFQKMVMELVAKCLTYSKIDTDEECFIPQLDDEGNSVLVGYKTMASDLGDGNLAYIFRPSNDCKFAHPIISFRGTSPANFSTVRSSLGLRGMSGLLTGFYASVGDRVVQSNKHEFIEILKELQEEHGKKTRLTGHSLGGAIAQKMMIEEGIYDQVEQVMAFNAPSINRSACHQWNQLVAAGKVEDTQAIVYNMKGDPLVDHTLKKLNHYFIGEKVELEVSGSRPKNLSLHSSAIGSLGCREVSIVRADTSRSMMMTALIGCIHILKLPFAIVAMAITLVTIEPINAIYTMFSQDQYDRSLSRHLADSYIRKFKVAHPALSKAKMISQLWLDRDFSYRAELQKEIKPQMAFSAGLVL